MGAGEGGGGGALIQPALIGATPSSLPRPPPRATRLARIRGGGGDLSGHGLGARGGAEGGGGHGESGATLGAAHRVCERERGADQS